MSAFVQKKRKNQKIGFRITSLTKMTIALIFSAVCIAFTMAVRAEITALSNEAVSIEAEIAELEAEKRLLTAEYEQVYSPEEIEKRALENGMISPSEVGYSFYDKPTEDMTIVGDSEKSDKQKSVWEFFDELINMMY